MKKILISKHFLIYMKFQNINFNKNSKGVNKFLGFNIDIKVKNISKDYSKYLNKESIFLINNFYKKDFELFKYELNV